MGGGKKLIFAKCRAVFGAFQATRGKSNVAGSPKGTMSCEENISLSWSSRHLDCAGRAQRRRRSPTRESGGMFSKAASRYACRRSPNSPVTRRSGINVRPTHVAGSFLNRHGQRRTPQPSRVRNSWRERLPVSRREHCSCRRRERGPGWGVLFGPGCARGSFSGRQRWHW